MFEPFETAQLVSVDGVRGRDLLPITKNFLQKKRRNEAGFSTWDASSIFFELNGLRREVGEHPSAQTLILLYAADLRFRLRWEIEPGLSEGKLIVATPYVETGIAFGMAMGLNRRWLSEVFRFAPKPYMSYWVKGARPTATAASTGFLEFCGDLPADFYERFTAHFVEQQRLGKCRPLDF